MTFDLVAGMEAVAARFPAGKAHTDPAKAFKNLPCVLVGPPVVDPTEGAWGAPEAVYPIYALSSKNAGTLDAVKQLNTLVQLIEETLQYERATPIRYQLTATGDPVAAYLCTHTEIQD
jgi:hypothetical protein